MHGGMKAYTGAPARNYVEADRGRADDYYLAEGTGVARRFTASGDGHVAELAAMAGDGYEAWVAGVDPDTGVPRGRLRTDDRAVRFVEVTVNGPKSWSLAAELHPDIAAAYDAAQDRAAAQVIGWLAEHATTRIGPRGQQVQIPVEQLEAVTVWHYTSRAGDPHRHLHLQINARVFAAGAWRGLHTVGVRDSLNAINGIGHAAVATDPAFRAALAAHGFTLNGESGEISQLAPYVGAFSRRAAQIGRNLNRYETDWKAAHAGRQPGPGLLRAWDARAWADGRPDKITPRRGADLHHRWLGELTQLGYRDPDTLFNVITAPIGARVGELDREHAVQIVLARLAAGRSRWNAADVRGEIEHLLTRANIVTEAAVRGELAEDLTARALDRCAPLLDQAGIPEHIRALTSPHVLEVERDLQGRLAVRGAEAGRDVDISSLSQDQMGTDRRVDAGQAAAVAALAGTRALVVIEGAAGAGKTTTLAATRDLLTEQGHRLVVVTPTLKAAKVAQAEVGAQSWSAAWLVFQHGWRWDQHGTWTRLAVGDADPVTGRTYTGPSEKAQLRAGDLLVVDEAGMVDQDTARALLALVDEQGVRVALMGDRHQLAAVGRGGVLDLAARWADPQACVTLDVIHRFTRDVVTPTGVIEHVVDLEYAALSLAMRDGDNPAAVFDALRVRGQIRLHPSDADRQAWIADVAATGYAAGELPAVVVDTREQVADLNAATRERLIATGHVDDAHTVTTGAGQRIGVGDRIATRRNDPSRDVANRDTWTVTGVHSDGSLVVRPGDPPNTGGDAHTSGGDTHTRVKSHADSRVLPAGYVREHVELAYATTVHGVQGDTVPTAHLLLGEHTGAASAYVGMTRGRTANTAHLVAESLEEAREQWVATFGRDGADRGPAHAAEQAAREAVLHAPNTQPQDRREPARELEQVIVDLRAVWDEQDVARTRLAQLRQRLDRAEAALPRVATAQRAAGTAWQAYQAARDVYAQARQQLAQVEQATTATAEQALKRLSQQWDTQRATAHADARRVQEGPGRLGRGKNEVQAAQARLQQWAAAWEPVVGNLSTRWNGLVGFAAAQPGYDRIDEQLHEYAAAQARRVHPEHADATTAVEKAAEASSAASGRWSRITDANRWNAEPGDRHATLEAIALLRQHIAGREQQLTATDDRLDALASDPAVTALPHPAGWLASQHQTWRTDHDQDRAEQANLIAAARAEQQARAERQRSMSTPYRSGPERSGPSIGM